MDNIVSFYSRNQLLKEITVADYADVTLHIQDGKLVYWEETTKHKPNS